MTPGLQLELRFYELIGKTERFTDEDIQALRECLHNTTFPMVRPHVLGKAQLRADVEMIDAIRRFDEASGRLVETTNCLTRKGLWLAAAAILVAFASLAVSIIALMR